VAVWLLLWLWLWLWLCVSRLCAVDVLCGCGCAQGAVVERIELGSSASLYERAHGAVVHVRRVDEAHLGLRLNLEAEMLVPVRMPDTVRPCARLGKVGDVVGLRESTSSGTKSAHGRAERVSGDSVITEEVVPA
jgi:hypothetical protein